MPVSALALDAAESREATAPSSTPPAPAGWEKDVLRGVRILVVDDDPSSRELLVALFSGAGAHVRVAGSVHETIGVLQTFRPEVLVSDIGMPGEDGYALIRWIRGLEPELGGAIPSLALTAFARSEDRTKALATGFTAHMGKPAEPGSLIAAVADLANSARQ